MQYAPAFQHVTQNAGLHGFGNKIFHAQCVAAFLLGIRGARRQHDNGGLGVSRSEEHTSELQSQSNFVFRSLLDISFFFFNYTATAEIYSLSLHDALPICAWPRSFSAPVAPAVSTIMEVLA